MSCPYDICGILRWRAVSSTLEGESQAQGSEVGQPPEAAGAARRVALNALSPFVAQLFTKALMLGYLIVQYRLAGGPGVLGHYFLAGLLLMYTGTVADWGLTTLLTREAAKGRGGAQSEERTATLFRQTLSLRLLLSLALLLPTALFVAVYMAFFNLSVEGAWAVGLLTLSLLPGAFSGAVSALLYAHERMGLPAAIGVATSILNVILGVGALLLGWGIVGLSVAALVASCLTALPFWRILRRDFPTLRVALAPPLLLRLDRPVALSLLRAGWPLMLNALLVGLFFRIDGFIIQPVLGEFALQQYSAAYSFLNFVLLITPAVTLALFPRMARHAASDRPRLLHEFTFALKALLVLSVPIVLFTVWFAPLLVSVLTGFRPEYLPGAATALQILIFFLPFSFINGLTQYVLIALDLQRLITRAFALTTAFNLAANLVLVPLYDIRGAAVATILSELVLLGPFLVWVGREVGSVGLPALAFKPALAGAVVGVIAWLLWPLAGGWFEWWGSFALYALCGVALLALYCIAIILLQPFTPAELKTLRGVLRRAK